LIETKINETKGPGLAKVKDKTEPDVSFTLEAEQVTHRGPRLALTEGSAVAGRCLIRG
jgi:hypothetical protein